MENKVIVLSRYEYWASGCKQFTKWFAQNINPMNENEAEEYIKNQKINSEFIDKKTKLKHEYTTKSYDEYINEQYELKNHIKELTEKNKAYYKSNEFKQLQKMKRQAAKERKNRQEKYKQEHGL